MSRATLKIGRPGRLELLPLALAAHQRQPRVRLRYGLGDRPWRSFVEQTLIGSPRCLAWLNPELALERLGTGVVRA